MDGQIDIHYWYPELRLSRGGHRVQREEAQAGAGGQAGAQQAGGKDDVPERQPGMMACLGCQLRGGTGCPENWQHIISGCV